MDRDFQGRAPAQARGSLSSLNQRHCRMTYGATELRSELERNLAPSLRQRLRDPGSEESPMRFGASDCPFPHAEPRLTPSDPNGVCEQIRRGQGTLKRKTPAVLTAAALQLLRGSVTTTGPASHPVREALASHSLLTASHRPTQSDPPECNPAVATD